VEQSEVEAERRDAHGFRVDVDPRNLLSENLAQLVRTQAAPELANAMTHDSSERFDEEDARAARRVHYARFPVKNVLGEDVREHKFDEGARRVITAVGWFLPTLDAVKLLVYAANQLDRDNVEPISEEEELALGVPKEELLQFEQMVSG